VTEFEERQLLLVGAIIANFRKKEISLNRLIGDIEGVSKALGEIFWSTSIFPHVLNLELINSELIDKNRTATASELVSIEETLKAIEEIVTAYK
jgi:hypothetical protein